MKPRHLPYKIRKRAKLINNPQTTEKGRTWRAEGISQRTCTLEGSENKRRKKREKVGDKMIEKMIPLTDARPVAYRNSGRSIVITVNHPPVTVPRGDARRSSA